MNGSVILVGAGPGDPDLLTVKAHKCLATAEVIVYDRLVNNELLGLAPSNCKMIYAGKRKNLHAMSQDEINSALIAEARSGKKVIRLKGGDPFIFGRGGEEIDELINAGIDWEVIPGITAAIGAAASGGLPLTYRDKSQAVTFVTAHRQHGELDIDWSLVMHSNQSVVFYMGLTLIEEIVATLMAMGKDPDTPFSISANATRNDEILVSSTLSEITRELKNHNLPSPAILIMGPIPRRPISVPELAPQQTQLRT
jgi:uroporphyrin-III C-methyltransferase